MSRLAVGQRVIVSTVRGLPGEWEPLDLGGFVERIDERPWGTDALVRLDEPQLIGNLNCEGLVGSLSLSVGSLNLKLGGF